MFSLDRFKNDTSLSLDLLRAIAAQMVCVGHALNFSSLGHHTTVPATGVLLFFILSGFVIAHTLKAKTAETSYTLGRYAIERASRIYCAYLPAMLAIGVVQIASDYFGIFYKSADPTDLRTFLANVFMLQGYPGLPFGTFGVAGQMTSIAVEFHIYFFVGALYFLCIGRQMVFAAIVAIASAKVPLGYFLLGEGRALFALWLLGFAAYFVAHTMPHGRAFPAIFTVAAIGILYAWYPFWNLINVYDLANFPALMLCFLVMVVVSQSNRMLASSKRAGILIHFFASSSLTLFLVHLTVIRAVFAVWPTPSWVTLFLSIVTANIVAYCFSKIGEVHYRRVADYFGGLIGCPRYHLSKDVSATGNVVVARRDSGTISRN